MTHNFYMSKTLNVFFVTGGGILADKQILNNGRQQQQTKQRLEYKMILPSLFLLEKIYRQK